jgi:hypothetical protein
MITLYNRLAAIDRAGTVHGSSRMVKINEPATIRYVKKQEILMTGAGKKMQL